MNTIRKVAKLMEEEKYTEIAEIIIDLPESEKTDEIMHLLADAYTKLGEYDLSLEVLNDLSEQYKKNSGYKWLFSVATALFNCGRPEAGAYAEACLGFNPPEEVISECERILEDVTRMVSYPAIYSENEFEKLVGHIEKYYGKIISVFQDSFSPEMHVDVAVIPPHDDKNYFTFVTVGMGAYLMNVSQDTDNSGRAELLICLPDYWKTDSKETKWFWPVKLLKTLARLPAENNSWIGWGDSAEDSEPFSEDTALCGSILVDPQKVDDEAVCCELDGGQKVNFYQVIPLYHNEIQFKKKYGATELLKRMKYVSFVVKTDRHDCCAEIDENGIDMDMPMDLGTIFEDRIEEEGLPLDPINAYNHIAIYMRWCIEHNMMCDRFMRKYGDVVEAVKNKDESFDFREFIRDELDGELRYSYFNSEGVKFAKYYYSAYNGGHCSPFYPRDVYNYADEFFVGQEWAEDIYKDRFLFIPYDERYYKGMCKYLDKTYENMKTEEKDAESD